LSSPVEIVIGNTGKVTDTKAAVDGVKQRKEMNQKKYQETKEWLDENAGNKTMAEDEP
jgi:mevalonate kinase